jgi:quercetin dioxygenase-like cupin family protein
MLQSEIFEKWDKDTYFVVGVDIPEIQYPNIPWVPYEDYMRARLIKTEPGKTGEIIVEFPIEGSEDNQLHIHPFSDRVITVVKGSGKFVAIRKGERIEQEFFPGCRVWMPRGTLHTFFSGSEGLTVHSIHNPWIPLDNPQCLVYPS